MAEDGDEWGDAPAAGDWDDDDDDDENDNSEDHDPPSEKGIVKEKDIKVDNFDGKSEKRDPVIMTESKRLTLSSTFSSLSSSSSSSTGTVRRAVRTAEDVKRMLASAESHLSFAHLSLQQQQQSSHHGTVHSRHGTAHSHHGTAHPARNEATYATARRPTPDTNKGEEEEDILWELWPSDGALNGLPAWAESSRGFHRSSDVPHASSLFAEARSRAKRDGPHLIRRDLLQKIDVPHTTIVEDGLARILSLVEAAERADVLELSSTRRLEENATVTLHLEDVARRRVGYEYARAWWGHWEPVKHEWWSGWEPASGEWRLNIDWAHGSSKASTAMECVIREARIPFWVSAQAVPLHRVDPELPPGATLWTSTGLADTIVAQLDHLVVADNDDDSAEARQHGVSQHSDCVFLPPPASASFVEAPDRVGDGGAHDKKRSAVTAAGGGGGGEAKEEKALEGSSPTAKTGMGRMVPAPLWGSAVLSGAEKCLLTTSKKREQLRRLVGEYLYQVDKLLSRGAELANVPFLRDTVRLCWQRVASLAPSHPDGPISVLQCLAARGEWRCLASKYAEQAFYTTSELSHFSSSTGGRGRRSDRYNDTTSYLSVNPPTPVDATPFEIACNGGYCGFVYHVLHSLAIGSRVRYSHVIKKCLSLAASRGQLALFETMAKALYGDDVRHVYDFFENGPHSSHVLSSDFAHSAFEHCDALYRPWRLINKLLVPTFSAAPLRHMILEHLFPFFLPRMQDFVALEKHV